MTSFCITLMLFSLIALLMIVVHIIHTLHSLCKDDESYGGMLADNEPHHHPPHPSMHDFLGPTTCHCNEP
ncbi:hypothetical protein KP509_27G025700 [Ceratopteris richardii]|uniref:Uncharacterized protein n=1 Tax=Ceratopteris richardii TaxID=49495 RepID=A0A8T2RGK1_CERRI|nr:hypothetical protein KP509_27G025700 [Ceratopteris richardii]